MNIHQYITSAQIPVPANEYEKALIENCIGEYGVCIDDEKLAGKGKFLYLIEGKYAGGKVPEGMMLYGFPQSKWAVFDCVGAIPNALQSLNTRSMNDEKTDPDYHSAVLIPVKRK